MQAIKSEVQLSRDKAWIPAELEAARIAILKK